MSYHVFFAFSSSFSATLRVPKGTLAGIWDDITSTEAALGLQRVPNYTPDGEAQRPGWRWASWEARRQRNLAKHCNGNGMGTPLTIAVQQWPTPLVGMGENSHGQMSGQFRREMDKSMGTKNAKLSPRWVEILMGTPLGWVCPSAPASVIRNWPRFVVGWSRMIIAPTS